MANFSRYSAIIVCLFSSSRVPICAFELFRSSSCLDQSTILAVWMFPEKTCDTKIFLIDRHFSPSGCLDPFNIADDDD